MYGYISRELHLPEAGTETFFLWGPRQTGKSTLLKKTYPGAIFVNLMRPEEYRRYLLHPEWLGEEVARAKTRFVVIDEIQRVPQLLDEVHFLHEDRGTEFALCGSSARKVRMGHANLLGGRGVRYELFGFSARELGAGFDLVRALNSGWIPRIHASPNPARLLNTYVSQYLREEIAAEALVRRLPAFAEFLNVAALSDGEQVNYSTVAREVGASVETIRGYFEILCDTLQGRFLPPYRRRPKRRIAVAPKFYFADVGVVNFLARRGRIEPRSELFGKAFESWIFHELCCYNAYRETYADIFFWRLSSGVEVDFVINHIDCAVEAKASARISSEHLKGLREFAADHPEAKRRLLVCLDEKDRKTGDGIEIVGWRTFLEELWSGKLFNGQAPSGPSRKDSTSSARSARGSRQTSTRRT